MFSVLFLKTGMKFVLSEKAELCNSEKNSDTTADGPKVETWLCSGNPFLACGDSGHMRGSGVGTGRGSHLGMETAVRFSLNHL